MWRSSLFLDSPCYFLRFSSLTSRHMLQKYCLLKRLPQKSHLHRCQGLGQCWRVARGASDFPRASGSSLGDCTSQNFPELPQKFPGLSGTGDSQRDSRESIHTNHSQFKSLFLKRVVPIRANHSTKSPATSPKLLALWKIRFSRGSRDFPRFSSGLPRPQK